MDLKPSEKVDLFPISEHIIPSPQDKTPVEQSHEALPFTNGSTQLGNHLLPKMILTREILMIEIAGVI
jgi:hypothetical protein